MYYSMLFNVVTNS